MNSAIPPPAAVLAGLSAEWVDLELEVEEEGRGPLKRVSVGHYGLAQPERDIDAAALLREADLPDPPYWTLVWTGARAIAALLLEGPDLTGLRVLDLGCGLGLAGLAAADRGASVVFGDYLEAPLQFVRASLGRREPDLSRLQAVRRIDFTRDRLEGRFDLILAADIVYDTAHYGPLADFLDLHVAGSGTVLLTESLRADARVFLDAMTRRGFSDRRCGLWVMEDGRRERTWLHRLSRKAESPS